MDRITARDAAYGKRELRNPAFASSDCGGLHHVDARSEIALQPCVKTSAAVIVVCYAAAVFSHQMEVGIALSGRQVHPDPPTLD